MPVLVTGYAGAASADTRGQSAVLSLPPRICITLKITATEVYLGLVFTISGFCVQTVLLFSVFIADNQGFEGIHRDVGSISVALREVLPMLGASTHVVDLLLSKHVDIEGLSLG